MRGLRHRHLAVAWGLFLPFLLAAPSRPSPLAPREPQALYPPPNTLLECGSSIVVHDMTGDGLEDVLVGCSSTNDDAVGGVLLFRRDRAGAFHYLSAIRQQRGERADGCGSSVAVGDVDGDRRPDIAIGCFADTLDRPRVKVIIALNRGEGRFEVGALAVTGPQLSPLTGCKSALQGGDVALGDIDGDRRADLVVGCPEVGDDWGATYVLRRKTTNDGFEAPISLRRGETRRFAGCGWRVAVADVNGDARGDVIATCPYDQAAPTTAIGPFYRQGTLIVFRRDQANRGFEPALVLAHPRPQPSMECGSSVAAGDVNGDRRADVLWGCDSRSSVVLFRSSRRGFDAGTVLAGGAPLRTVRNDLERCGESVALADVDRDRRVDLVVGCGFPIDGERSKGAALVFRHIPGNRFARAIRVASGAARVQEYCGDSVGAVARPPYVLLGCTGTYRGNARTGAVRLLRLTSR
jgi:hypothetical protein